MPDSKFQLTNNITKEETNIQSLFKKVEEFIFSLIYILLKDDNEITTLYYLLLTFEFFQFISFPFEPVVNKIL